jgi:hypothetical protein
MRTAMGMAPAILHSRGRHPAAPDGVADYRRLFYDAAWRVLEERESESDTAPRSLRPRYQYV